MSYKLKKEILTALFAQNQAKEFMEGNDFQKYQKIRTALEDEMLSDSLSMKNFFPVDFPLNKRRSFMRDPFKVKMKNITDKNKLYCILTGELILPDDDCIAFVVRDDKHDCSLRCLVKKESDFKMILNHGTVEKTLEYLHSRKTAEAV